MNQKTEKKPKISIIIPLYNVEEYVSACLNSLINQTIGTDNMQIIIVDDRSPDNSIDIVKKYAKKYPKLFTVIQHEKNLGPGGARNTGLKNATGKYITFVDPDDFVDKKTYKILTEKMQREQIDLTIYEMRPFSDSRKKHKTNPSQALTNLNKMITKDQIEKYPEIIFAQSTCNKIFTKELIKKIGPFPEKQKYNEDAVFSFNALIHANTIFVTNKTTYHYRRRENPNNPSTTETKYQNKKNYFDRCAYHEFLLEAQKENPNLHYAIDWYNARDWFRFAHNILTNTAIQNCSIEERKELFDRTGSIYKNFSKTNEFPDVGFYQKNLIHIMQRDLSFDKTLKIYKRNYEIIKFLHSVKKYFLLKFKRSDTT